MGIKIKDNKDNKNNEYSGLEYTKKLLQGMALTLFLAIILLLVLWVVLALMMAFTG